MRWNSMFFSARRGKSSGLVGGLGVGHVLPQRSQVGRRGAAAGFPHDHRFEPDARFGQLRGLDGAGAEQVLQPGGDGLAAALGDEGPAGVRPCAAGSARHVLQASAALHASVLRDTPNCSAIARSLGSRLPTPRLAGDQFGADLRGNGSSKARGERMAWKRGAVGVGMGVGSAQAPLKQTVGRLPVAAGMMLEDTLRPRRR
jgi:hypothetical protein